VTALAERLRAAAVRSLIALLGVLLALQLTLPMAMTDLNRVTSLLNSILTGATWPTVPSGWWLRLMQTTGSGSSNGTELSSATGYTTGGATMAAWSTISGTTASITGPSTAISWTNSGGSAWTAVAGIEIWDNAATKLRWFWGSLSGGSVTVNAGNTLQFATNSIGLNGTGW
jgi:hypothetical protein